MKNYSITVNGNVYDVTVEETAAGTVTAAPKAAVPKAAVPKAAPAAAPKAAPKAPVGAAGATKIEAPMPGKILDVKVNVGAAVKKGTVLFVLEAMKMENEIVAPSDGTVASINVSKNQTVEPGETLGTLN